MYQYLKRLYRTNSTDDSYVNLMQPYEDQPSNTNTSVAVAEEPEGPLILPASRSPPSSDKSLLGSRQDAQLQSPIFSKLPLEIRRMIYYEVWQSAGLSQHISPGNGGLGCTACLVEDHFSDDLLGGLNTLWDSQPLATDANLYSPEWYGHMLSSVHWSNHWRCWENKQQKPDVRRTPTPFLSMLLCCRIMYLETSQSISESVIFACTDFITARRFLGPRLPLAIVPRKIAVSLRYDPSWIDTSIKRLEDASQPGKFVWKRIPQPTKFWNSTINLFLAPGSRRHIYLWLQTDPVGFPQGLSAEAGCLFSHLSPEDAKRLTVSLPMRFNEESHPSEGNDIQVTPEVRWRRFSPYFLSAQDSYIHRIDYP